MFEIAICDNEKYFRQELKQMLAKDMMDRGLVFQIDSFASGEEFTALGIGIVKYTIIFLDIHLENMDGFMTAKKIRAVSKEVFIVFVTEYEDYALQGYKVDAIRYLLKGDLELKSEIHECLDAIIEKMNYKIREAQMKKIPYTLVLGNQEQENRTITYRHHGSNESVTMGLNDFIEMIITEIKTLGKE